MAAIPFVNQFVTFFFACSFAIGFGFGGVISDYIALAGDLFGTKYTSSVLGVLQTATGIGGMIGPMIAGLYYDSLGLIQGCSK